MTLFPKKLGHCVKMEMDRKLGYLNTEMPHLIEENNISHIEPEVFFVSLYRHVKTKQQHISGLTSHMLFGAVLS